MAGKSDFLEQLFLDLIFKNTTNAAWASAGGTATQLYVALCTADPIGTESNTAASMSETTYTGYARVAVARGAGWTRTGSSISPAANIDFGQCTAGTATITHFAIVSSSAGAGDILYGGTVTPSISVSNGVIPRLTTATAITED